ncbi:MAG TPA: hypothetical protein IAA23_02645 [Candidatus Helicobacter avistercoris]|nr:hypothetical protein [Candidatus Helicobacter avistercoris]
MDSIFQQGVRDLKLDISWSGNISMGNILSLTRYQHFINTQVNAKKWSNSIYALEKYNFTKDFSPTAGIRYELA